MKKLTTEELEKRLLGTNIKIVNFVNATSKVKFQCDICYFVWEETLFNFLKQKQCFICYKESYRKKYQDKFDMILSNRNFIRLDNYIYSNTELNLQCVRCKVIIFTKPKKFQYDLKFCASCKYINFLSKTELNLKKKNIKCLDVIVNTKISMRFECLKCNHTWIINLENMGSSECAKCSSGKSEKIIYSALSANGIVFEYQKQIRKININEKNKIRTDFCIDNKIIIEYNGRQHYEPVSFGSKNKEEVLEKFKKQKKRDLYLQNFCDQNNIKLIWIDVCQYQNDKLKYYVINNLIPEINKYLNE